MAPYMYVVLACNGVLLSFQTLTVPIPTSRPKSESEREQLKNQKERFEHVSLPLSVSFYADCDRGS